MANQKITQLNSITWSSVDANNDVIPIVDVNDTSMSPSGTTKKISAGQLISSLVPQTRTLTINGTTQDLSANRTWTIPTGLTVGTTAISSGTVGRILFEGTGNVLQEDSALFWDNTNKRLGVGATPSTSVRLDVRAQGALSTDIALRVRNSANSADILRVRGDNSIIFGNNTSLLGDEILYLNGESVTNSQLLTIRGDGAQLVLRLSRNRNFILGGAAGQIAYDGSAIRHATTGWHAFNTSVGIGNVDITPGATRLKIFATGSTNNDISLKISEAADQLYFLGNSNLIIGDSTTNADGVRVFVMKNGTAPSANMTDTFKLYSADIVAGNAAPHFRTENGDVVKLYRVGGWGLPTGTFTRTTFDTATVTTAELAERVAALIQDLRDNHGLLKA